MTDPATYRGHDLNNPAEYPARYEVDWLRRRPRRIGVRVALMVLAFAAFLAPLGWPGALVAGVLAGALHLAYFWRRHHSATAWHKDAYAERESVRALRPLERRGYRVLYDHFHEDVQVQSLLVGPTGVWPVHAVGRPFQRRLWGDAAFPHPGKQPVPPAPEELRDRAAAAGETVTVRPLYLAIGDDVPDSVRKNGPVPVLTASGFGDHLTGEPVRLAPDEGERLATLTARVLPAQHSGKEGPVLPPMAVRKTFLARRKGVERVRETEIGRHPDD